MKRKVFLSLTVAILAGSFFIYKNARADANKSVTGCMLKDIKGNIIKLGNTCDPGQTTCLANPCSVIGLH